MQYWTHRRLWNLIPCMRKGFWQLSGSAAPWRRGRACLLLDSAPHRAIAAGCRCCHPLQQWYLALILIWNVHGSCIWDGWGGPNQEVALHLPIWMGSPSNGSFFFFGWWKQILFRKATFSLFCLCVWNSCNNMPDTCREQKGGWRNSLLC